MVLLVLNYYYRTKFSTSSTSSSTVDLTGRELYRTKFHAKFGRSKFSKCQLACGTTGPFNTSSPLFVLSVKTNTKFPYEPSLARNWAKFAFLKC